MTEKSFNRREFLRGTAWMGAAAVAAGCTGPRLGFGTGGSMFGFAAKPMRRVRVGVVGLGCRGRQAIPRLAAIPGVEVAALCDLEQWRIDAQQKKLADFRKPKAREFAGAEAYRAMCDWDGIDVVYNTAPWHLYEEWQKDCYKLKTETNYEKNIQNNSRQPPTDLQETIDNCSADGRRGATSVCSFCRGYSNGHCQRRGRGMARQSRDRQAILSLVRELTPLPYSAACPRSISSSRRLTASLSGMLRSTHSLPL